MYTYRNSGKKISQADLSRALNRLGDLLKTHNKRLEMVVAGGVISLLYFRSRTMTEDVDAIFPYNPANRALLVSLIKQVGDELGFATSPRSVWFNDSVSFFGLQTKSDVVVFNHPFLCLKAAKWEELLAHKVHAFRDEKDIADAVLLFKQITGKTSDQLFADVVRYAPISPDVPTATLRRNFDEVAKRAQKT